MKQERLRLVTFRPYRVGCGPIFKLRTWDAGMRSDGKARIRYELRMYPESGRCARHGAVLFAGDDFGCSPMDAIDSDACINALMSFLTLRPGDTDREYFKDYSQSQLDYCALHAEALSCAVHGRFGYDS